MPHERIYGARLTIYDDKGKPCITGTPVLDIGWRKGLEGITFGLSMHTEDTADQPGQLVPMPSDNGCTVGSWSQVNRLMAVLKRARNDAYGTPE